jgi:pyridoxal phosphate enzyme (YggS family)
MSDPVVEAVARVCERIASACQRSGRPPGSVRLIAVTKTVPIEVVRQVAALTDVVDFGENRARDLAAKAQAVKARWHFIGKVQRGTAGLVAEHADEIHSCEPGEGLAAVARKAKLIGRGIRCLAQVDFTGARQGVAPQDAGAFLDQARSLDGLEFVGLMTLPPITERPEGARPFFARLRELRGTLETAHPELQELSMGMSADYEVAIEEGATMVRIGTALFERAARWSRS